MLRFNNQEWNGFEAYESRLIRINNVTFSQTGNFDLSSSNSSGSNYTISDTTGTLVDGFRVDAEVASIIGTPIPNKKVDVIGILGQYKSSAPFNSGYQLLPRDIHDLIQDSSPLILNPVFASDIDTSSFTVYFNTARKGNSQIKYGLTSALELDSVIINDDTTVHSIRITGLKPLTTYYYKAVSSNSIGTSVSGIKSVTTLAVNPGSGTINIYFNNPVDTSVALPGNSARVVDFQSKLINRINAAKTSIDMAVYSFQDMPDVAQALVLAKNRGVKIRVVYDNRNMQNSMQTLLNAGIKYSQRPPETQSFPGIMHNKFFIFDARDTVASNDWLWTGSWNVTNTELTWKNNVVEINDPVITKAYQTEFEEMWGSSSDTPNPANAKFGPYKSDNTQHLFTIGGREVDVYFSPSDHTTSHIISAINSADDDIYMAQYVITKDDIASAIKSAYDSGAKDIRGVVYTTSGTGSEYDFLSTFADMHPNSGNVLHDKYGIVDAEKLNSDPIVITGSHNWSAAAENNNDENTLIIHDAKITNQYLQNFKKIYNDAGGTGVFEVPTSTGDSRGITKFSYQLFQNYPNPFNPVTTIKFELPAGQNVSLTIYDMLGREVKTLYNGYAPAGITDVDFSAGDLASGIYFYRLQAGSFVVSHKLILLK